MPDELCDVWSERAILGACFRYGADVFIDVDDLVTDRSFTVDSNRTIFKCLRHLFGQDPECVPDVPSILSAARAIGLETVFEDAEELKHLRAVLNTPVEKNNARKLAAKVRKLEVARAGLEIGDQIKDGLLKVTGDESVAAILNLLEAPVFEFVNGLAKDQQDGPKPIGADIDLFLAHLEQHPVDQMGLPLGLPNWERAVGGGARPGTLNVFGARPKTGKTSLGLNIGRFVASQLNLPVLYLDTEMTDKDHKVKMLAALSGVPMKTIETGKFASTEEGRQKVAAAADVIRPMPYEPLSIAGQPFEETVAIMRRWLVRRVGLGSDGKAKPCLIIFDYLKLMEASGLSKHLQEFQLLGFIMTGLHNFAVKYGVPIVLFVQLNRDGIEAENSTAASGSDRIIWLCSNFTIFKPLTDEEMADQTGRKKKFNRKFKVSECRHGPGLDGDDFIYVDFQRDCCLITEGPTVNQLRASDPTKPFSVDGGADVAF
jgi:replicative DNA helicase